MTEYLLVHDCSTAAVLGAAVFCRIAQASGAEVQVWFDPAITGRTGKFWTDGVSNLLCRDDRQRLTLVLFGITFNDRDPGACLSAIERFEAEYSSVAIWTHRFPDGYRKAGLDVRIPPDDLIYNDPNDETLRIMGRFLDGYDKQLLTTSLIAARAVPGDGLPDEQSLARKIAKGLDTHPQAIWQHLTNGSTSEIPEVVWEESVQSLAGLFRLDRAYEKATKVVELSLAKEHARNAADALAAFAAVNALPKGAVMVCWILNEESDAERLLLTRNDNDHEYPALRWLIEQRYASYIPEVLRNGHFGPQDVVYFSIPQGATRAELSYSIDSLATKLAAHESGGRFLTAALTRDIARVGNELLKSIDLTGKYTAASQPDIRIAEETIYVLLHRSSRTGRRQATLTVPIEARGAAAVAFLYRENGYNLQKLERALEGSLVALRMRSLTWMQPKGLREANVHLPARVRLDIRPLKGRGDSDARFAQAVQAALGVGGMSTIDMRQGNVADDSIIGNVLNRARLKKLVCYNESETIGPSVAHALVLLSTASVAGEWISRGRRADNAGHRMTVLDLFSGSGIANRLLTEEKHSVTSVDRYVPAGAVGLEFGTDGLWLKADARDVLDADNPILSQRFDVIGLDPPHAELLDALFASQGQNSLVRACANRSSLLVLYQGHSTQAGRLPLLMAGLQASGYPYASILQIEEELVIVAATKGLSGSFSDFVTTVIDELRVLISRWGLTGMSVMEFAVPLQAEVQ